MKKPFWVFATCNYYPSGGMHDFIGSFCTLEYAERAGRESGGGNDNYHVVDVREEKIVAVGKVSNDRW